MSSSDSDLSEEDVGFEYTGNNNVESWMNPGAGSSTEKQDNSWENDFLKLRPDRLGIGASYVAHSMASTASAQNHAANAIQKRLEKAKRKRKSDVADSDSDTDSEEEESRGSSNFSNKRNRFTVYSKQKLQKNLEIKKKSNEKCGKLNSDDLVVNRHTKATSKTNANPNSTIESSHSKKSGKNPNKAKSGWKGIHKTNSRFKKKSDPFKKQKKKAKKRKKI